MEEWACIHMCLRAVRLTNHLLVLLYFVSVRVRVYEQDVVDDVAEKLKLKCDMFDVEERNGRKVAVVVDPRSSRACPLIHDREWKDRIQINRVKNHFIFNVETTGALSPPDVVRLAFEVLQHKIDSLKVKVQP